MMTTSGSSVRITFISKHFKFCQSDIDPFDVRPSSDARPQLALFTLYVML
jgi:hypothetical protein